MITSLQRSLAETVTALARSKLPEVVRAKARACTLDVLSSVLAGVESSAASAARVIVADGEASMMGSFRGAAPGDAAHANAVAAIALLRDNVHLPSASHLGAVAVPAALALAEVRGIDGDTTLRSIIAGYQAAGRLGAALIEPTIARRFRPTGLVGPLAAAAAAGMVIGLSPAQLGNALGFAANAAAGFNEWAFGGGDEIYFQTGAAARAGVTAALLAEQGAVASPHAIDGPAGMLAAFGRSEAVAGVTSSTSDFEILNSMHKPFAACGAVQPVCQAIADAQSSFATLNAIRSIEIVVSPFAANYPGCAHSGPVASRLQAQQSIPFCAAAMLVHGALEPAFEALDDPAVNRLMRLSRVAGDPVLAERGGASITIVTSEDRPHHLECEAVQAIDGATLRKRFLAAATACRIEGAEALAARIAMIDLETNLKGLLRQLRPERDV